MSNTSSINFAVLNQAINRYIPIPFLLFGIIGNILNIIIFTRKMFRQNICAMYFLTSSIFDSFAIIIGLIPRCLNGFGKDPSQNFAILCKLRFFITYFSIYTAAWLISLACVERYLTSTTNVHTRQLITMKRAYLSIIAVIILGFAAFGEQFYCIDINQQLFGAPQSCYQLQQHIQCQIADGTMQFIFEMVTPVLVMIVFGSLTVWNVRKSHRRINAAQTTNLPNPLVNIPIVRGPSTNQQISNTIPDLENGSSLIRVDRTTQKRDTQLISMLLVQVIVFIISSFPIGVYKIYSFITIDTIRSIQRKSIENTIFNIFVIGAFLNNTITFYLYTLSGTIFRKELIKLLRLA